MPRTDADTLLAAAADDRPELARFAPAKINLALHVTGRRPDGYHALESLVVFARIGDRLSVADADGDRFTVAGPFAGAVPVGSGNLVIAARDALRASFPDAATPAVALHLEKLLPVASGLGGGSSDAAAALTALAAHWRLAGGPSLARIGLPLGADLPMCLAGRPLIASGIGETIEHLAGFPALPLVLVNPGTAVPTAAVFSALDRSDHKGLPGRPADWSAPACGRWLAATRNDLEAPAERLAPVIATVRAALAATGATLARMSGSGATCFGLYDSRPAAEHAARLIARRHPRWWVVATESVPSPAAGHG